MQRLLYFSAAVVACQSTVPEESCEARGTCGNQEQVMLQTASSFNRSRISEEVELRTAGYPKSGEMKANGLWCQVNIPPQNWHLKSCPFTHYEQPATHLKVLTYNLFWWNLFTRHGGSEKSAGKLIARSSGPEGYDLIGFQECDDRWRVLQDAKDEGLLGEWDALDGGRALALMYRKDRFEKLASGSEDVGEDDEHQHYGKRSAHWVRLRHRDGFTIFFVNHHGPLPVGWGGGCTGSATAMNIMRVIADNSKPEDGIILTGDFNAGRWSSRIRELDRRLHRVYSGNAMGGVDHVFSNCDYLAEGTNLGKGAGPRGSDHDALTVSLRFFHGGAVSATS